jgi:hypothetical protein
MARNKPTAKTAWVLLGLCLWLGLTGSGAGAGVRPGVQVMVLVDVSPDAKVQGPASQAAALLVHLLEEQDYLGLAALEEPAGDILTPAGLTPGHRRQALKYLAGLKPGPGRGSLAQAVRRGLDLFQAGGPSRRVLFLVSDAAPQSEPSVVHPDAADIKQAAAQVRAAGVEVVAAAGAPPSAPLQALVSEAGGRLWEAPKATDFHISCLRFYEYLDQPQQALIDGEHFLIDPWVRTAVVVATRTTPGKGVMLTTPQGVRLNPGARVKHLRWTGGLEYDLITLSPPQPGVWTLAKARLTDSRVFLATDLTLSAAGTPGSVAQDETLRVVAALSGNQEILKGLDLGSDTLFFAELAMPDTGPVTAKLRPRMSGAAPGGLPEAWVGRFPPPHGQGEGMLRILALGKSFQRLIAIPLAVTGPWYQGSMVPAGGQGEPALRFRPDPDRRLEGLRGSLTVKSAQGGLAGVLIKPAPGGEILLTRPPGCPEGCLADLRLQGTGPGGRPVEIASGPQPLEGPQKAAGKNLEPASPQTPNGKDPKSPQTSAPTPKRRWFWLALSGLGIAVFLGAAVLLFRLRSEGGNAGEKIQGEGSGKNVLTLKAQVEILTKEKAQLLEALNDKKNQMASLAADKADLQGALDRIKEKTQNSVKSIEDLEKKLVEAEQEARDMRQEYMALYARNQQEKETLKKN